MTIWDVLMLCIGAATGIAAVVSVCGLLLWAINWLNKE